MFSRIWHYTTRERDKGDRRAPLINPRGPATKSVLRTALTSRPPACGRLNSTSLSRFASGRHPWRPALVIRSPVRRFQRGVNTRAPVRPQSGRREKAEDKIAGSNFGQHLCWPRRGEPHGWGEQSAKRRFSLPGAGVARGEAASPPGTFTAEVPA